MIYKQYHTTDNNWRQILLFGSRSLINKWSRRLDCLFSRDYLSSRRPTTQVFLSTIPTGHKSSWRRTRPNETSHIATYNARNSRPLHPARPSGPSLPSSQHHLRRRHKPPLSSSLRTALPRTTHRHTSQSRHYGINAYGTGGAFHSKTGIDDFECRGWSYWFDGDGVLFRRKGQRGRRVDGCVPDDCDFRIVLVLLL